MIQCPYCKQTNSDDEMQCQYCGEWLDLASTTKIKKKKNITKPIQKQQQSPDTGSKYGSAIILFIVIIAAIIFLSTKLNNHSNVEKVKKIESPNFTSSVPTTRETDMVSEPGPAAETSPAPGTLNDLLNNAFALCSSGKCTDPEKAIEYLNSAIKLKPDLAEAYNNRGNAYCNLSQQQRAIEDYNEAIRLNPDYAHAFGNRGVAYSDLKQYQRAIEDFNEAIRLKPDYANAYLNRGNVYLIQNNKELGCKDLQKACELGICSELEKAKSRKQCL